MFLLALVQGFYAESTSTPSRLDARGSRAALGLKRAAHPRCTVADGQAGDAMGDELRRRLFVEREPELVPFGLRESYSAAAGALASMALHATPAGPSTPWVLLSMALALLCDFGPSARRDMTSSVAASLAAANDYVEAGPEITLGSMLTRCLGSATAHCPGLLAPTRSEPLRPQGPMGDCGAGEARPSLRRCAFHHDRLVDNYVNNPSAPDLITRSRQEAASSKLAASARWALLVRCRVAADAVGVMLMLSGRAALGAAFLLAAHSAFWYGGAAAARVDACANPSPLSPTLASIIRAGNLALAAAAAVCGLGWNARLRDMGGRTFAVTLVAIQVARLVADRVRARLHVGL